jgi:transposase
MLTLHATTRIYLYRLPVDMRKSFDGLSGIVRSQLEADPLDGTLFLFINRRRDRIKILHWDDGGFWLHYRLLEEGTFEAIESDKPGMRISATQLTMLLSGVPLKTRRRKRYRQDALGHV